MPRNVRRWLFKTEPESYSITDLEAAPNQTTFWDGVRNYQARNSLRDDVKLSHLVLVYHSGSEAAGVVGVAEVVREAYPDHTAWDSANDHFDPKASPANPIWQLVDIRLVEIFSGRLSLDQLRRRQDLAGLELLRRGSRLSIQPVSDEHFLIICQLGRSQPSPNAPPSTRAVKVTPQGPPKKVTAKKSLDKVRAREKVAGKRAAGARQVGKNIADKKLGGKKSTQGGRKA